MRGSLHPGREEGVIFFQRLVHYDVFLQLDHEEKARNHIHPSCASIMSGADQDYIDLGKKDRDL
jgi:hypothetical protein